MKVLNGCFSTPFQMLYGYTFPKYQKKKDDIWSMLTSVRKSKFVEYYGIPWLQKCQSGQIVSFFNIFSTHLTANSIELCPNEQITKHYKQYVLNHIQSKTDCIIFKETVLFQRAIFPDFF